MICIVGDRRTGKTTALIKMSAETGIPIFAPTFGMARCIERQAESMGVSMPKPEVLKKDSPNVFLYGRKVMIDEAQMILRHHFGIEAVCATFDSGHVEFKDAIGRMTLRELLGMWWEARRATDADGA